jgi:hypothetical protein
MAAKINAPIPITVAKIPCVGLSAAASTPLMACAPLIVKALPSWTSEAACQREP